jgi:hypothetical protein
VTALRPLIVGAFQVSVALALPATALTFVGADGKPPLASLALLDAAAVAPVDALVESAA